MPMTLEVLYAQNANQGTIRMSLVRMNANYVILVSFLVEMDPQIVPHACPEHLVIRKQIHYVLIVEKGASRTNLDKVNV